MRVYVMSFLLAGSLAFLAVAPPTRVTPDGKPEPATVTGYSPEAEVARIRAHFDSVLAELAARDLAGLTPKQRSNRAALVVTLKAYRDRGLFPQNYDFPGREVPYFVDRKTGVHCAVGHLLASSDRSDIVERVRRTNNNARVVELAGDTAFAAWLETNGLTLAEAARIQPTYGGGGVASPDHSYRNASAVAISASVVSTVWNVSQNRNGQRPVPSLLGLAIGAGTVGLGVLAETFPESSNRLALANGLAGGASMVVSVRGLMRRNREPKPTPAAEAGTSSRSVEASVTPAFSIVGQRTGGLTVNVRF